MPALHPSSATIPSPADRSRWARGVRRSRRYERRSERTGGPARRQRGASYALALIATLLAWWHVGCGRCAATADALDDATRAELGRVGVSERIDSGARAHIMVAFGADALSGALAAVDRDIVRGGRSQQTIGLETSRRATVELDLRVGTERTTLVATDDGGAAVDFTLSFDGSSVRTRTVDEDDVRMLEGQAHLIVPVHIEPRDAGFALVARLAAGRVDRVSAQTTDARSGAFVDGLVAARLRDNVATSSEAVELLAVTGIVAGDQVLPVAPARLGVAPDGSVTMGLVTALQPLGGWERTGDAPGPDEIVVTMHPDLPAAAVRHGWALGDAPRTIDRDGAVTVTGDVVVTVDEVVLDGARLAWLGTLWCARQRPCGVAPWEGTARVRPDAELGVAIDRPDVPVAAAPGGDVVVAGAPTRAVIERVRATLAAPTLLVAGQPLVRTIVDVHGDADRIAVTGRAAAGPSVTDL